MQPWETSVLLVVVAGRYDDDEDNLDEFEEDEELEEELEDEDEDDDDDYDDYDEYEDDFGDDEEPRPGRRRSEWD